MPDTELIGTLLALLDRARVAEQSLVTGLNDAERGATGTAKCWSAKDLIAHLTSWHTYLASLLSAVMSDETPEMPGPTINEANARFFAENEAKSWDTVVVESDQAMARVGGLLPQLSDEALITRGRYPWRRGGSLGPAVVRPLYWHPMLHLAEFYAQRGDWPGLEIVRNDLAYAADQLMPAPELRGNTLYMLANSYAAGGRSVVALPILLEALSLAPDMVPWSKRDPVFAPLLADPSYTARYGAD
jgi:hypothetical protein